MTGSTFLIKHFVKENALSGLPSHAMGRQGYSLELSRASHGLFILCILSFYTTGGTILIYQHWCCTTWHDNLLQVELISARPPSCHHCMACCAPCQSRPGEVFMGQDENEIKESSENALFFMMNKECERLTFLVVENSLPRCEASCSPATRWTTALRRSCSPAPPPPLSVLQPTFSLSFQVWKLWEILLR